MVFSEVGMLVRHTWRRLAIWSLFFTVCGCHSLNVSRPEKPDRTDKDVALTTPGTPSKHSFRIAQFLFLYDFDLQRDQLLFRELAGLRDQVCQELRLPGANAVVTVNLFEDKDRYERFMHSKYPDLPKRRAFFVAQPRGVGTTEDLLVYTYWGDRIQEDLRHELTHALLHSVLKDVPLWLDEGLAEYFEVPPDQKGINPRHLEQMRHSTSEPLKADLSRLEQLSQVQQMSPAEYREAWAWVHLMLRDRPEAKTVLVDYLTQLRTNPSPGPLYSRLTSVYPNPNKALERHLTLIDHSTSVSIH
jgi:hypothetical protein